MARPGARPLRIISERPAVPPRPEDLAAAAPVPAQAPGPDVLAELNRLAGERDAARADAAAAVQRGQEISEAAQRHVAEANARTETVRGQADAAIKATEAQLARAVEGQKQTGAVATAIVLGLVKQTIEALGRCMTWVPALGALGGGFWLFARALTTPQTLALVTLALYGGVVVAPAVLLTLRK